ncbi:MAG: twin-arginine translocase subunit TatC [Pseudomonadota bacterium]
MNERFQSRAMSFWEHLGELRVRLVRVVVTLAASFILCWVFREEIFAVINEPIRAALARHDIFRLIAIDAAEAITVYLKMSAAAALVLTMPVLLAQVWGFVKPGLYPQERRPVRRVVILSMLMFFIGVLFSYRLILPLVIDFLTAFTVGGEGIDFQLTMQSAFSTALLLMLMFGLVFQLPLVMVLLSATNILSWRHFTRYAKFFAVGAFVLGALLTPPDVLSQVLMAIPLLVLYAIGIGLAFLMEVGRQRRDVRSEPAVEASGPDWILFLGVLFLGGIVAFLVWPVGPGIAELVPPDPERALSWDRTRLPEGEGGLAELEIWTRRKVDPTRADRLVVAQYRDLGELVLLSGAAAVGCTGDGFPGTWEGGGPCYLAGDVAALGPPVLLAQVRHRHEQGEPGPAPVFPSGRDPPVAIFLRAEGRGQPDSVEIGVFEDHRVSVLLTMRDGGEARAMRWSLEAALDQAGEGVDAPEDAPDPLREVAALLVLMARDEEPAVKIRAIALADRLRDEPATIPSSLNLVDRLVGDLGSPEEVETDGNKVVIRFGPKDGVMERVLSLW